jgi:hypothetical protein
VQVDEGRGFVLKEGGAKKRITAIGGVQILRVLGILGVAGAPSSRGEAAAARSLAARSRAA